MSNLTNNRINVAMTAAQITAVKTALQAITAGMPFLTGLTIEERIALPKINVANKAFTEDAINAAANNSAMLPAYMNTAAMQSDMLMFGQLDELLGLIRQLLEKTEDTQMLVGSEAYVAALSSYRLFAAAATAGIPGADAVHHALKERFTGQGVPAEGKSQPGKP